MLSVETVATFFTASVLLALAPGPDNIFVLTQSALRGRFSGLVVVLGLCTGLIGHTLAVAVGVAVIFQASAAAFATLKYLGACYLLYLAWQALRAPAETIAGPGHGGAAYRRLYGRGIVMNLTNPKVSVFFLAFLPQFADPGRGAMSLQLTLLGGLFILATVLVFGAIALLGGTLGQWLHRSRRIQGVLHKVAGIVLVGLALKLAAADR